jgi:hypothetical protein
LRAIARVERVADCRDSTNRDSFANQPKWAARFAQGLFNRELTIMKDCRPHCVEKNSAKFIGRTGATDGFFLGRAG